MRLTAQGDVNQTVDGADASLHPHGEWREEDGEDTEEDVAAAHGCRMCFESVFAREWLVKARSDT